jgi:lipoate-protein ligase A
MARDHALALTLPPEAACIRLYRWERPTLSLGRNEPARGHYDPAELRERGIDVVRRPTGGRAVLHWRELTYAVVVPDRALGGPRGTFRAIHETLTAALVSLGLPARIAPPPPSPTLLDAGPCFRVAAGGEIVAQGRKLVGSAQLRVGDVLLQHGSILLGDDQRLLDGGEVRTDPPATVSELLRREPGPMELERAVLEAFGIQSLPPSSAVMSSIEADLMERYRSETWTWRR